MDDNYYWPSVSPNDLLSTDLPGREHLLQYFNENPTRSAPPSQNQWEEDDDRGKSYRDIRDGVLSQRRKNIFLESWGVDIKNNSLPLIHLDITRQTLDIEAVYVLAQVLRDEIFSQLEDLHIGQSEVFDLLLKEDRSNPTSALLSCQNLAGSIVIHKKLKYIRIAGIDLPISILRGHNNEKDLNLSHRGLKPIHGIIVGAGIKNNQILTNIDLRLNSETLGNVGLNSFSDAFRTGGVMKLKSLNGIILDGSKSSISSSSESMKSTSQSLTIHRSEEYELIWIARRLDDTCNRYKLKELILMDANLNEKTSVIVSHMISKMNNNIKLIDLSLNQSICGIRCDRYGIWRGETNTTGLDNILQILSETNRYIETLKFNGCSLGSKGVDHIASYLSNGTLKVRNLELCHCNMEYEDLSNIFKAIGLTRLPNIDNASYNHTSIAAVESTPSVDDSTSSFSASAWGRTDLNSSSSSSSSSSASSAWGRTDLNSSSEEVFKPCCMVECLDTRENPVNRSQEAELSLLMDKINDVGVLMCLNGIDFRPYKHLLAGPTSDHDGEEWWFKHRHNFVGANENVKLVEASGRLLDVISLESPKPIPSSSQTMTMSSSSHHQFPTDAPIDARRPRTTRGGYLDHNGDNNQGSSTSSAYAPPLDLGSGWFADGSDGDGIYSLNTSDWRKEKQNGPKSINSEKKPNQSGLAIHELCYATKMSLRMRITHLFLKGTRLCGLTSLGEGNLGMSNKERHIALEPLRSVTNLMGESAYLLSLDISDNGIGETDGGIELVSNALSSTVSLRSLNLTNNLLTPLHLEFLTGALELNSCLETLILGENLLGGYNAIKNPISGTGQRGSDTMIVPSSNVSKKNKKNMSNHKVALLKTTATGQKSHHHRISRRMSRESFSSQSSSGSTKISYAQSYTSSLSNGTKPVESLTSLSRPVSSIIARFISTIIERNNSLMKVDARENGWTDDEKELFADALDVPRNPPLKEFRIS